MAKALFYADHFGGSGRQPQDIMQLSREYDPNHQQEEEKVQIVPPIKPLSLDNESTKVILDLNSNLKEFIEVLSQLSHHDQKEPLSKEILKEEFTQKFEPIMAILEMISKNIAEVKISQDLYASYIKT